MRRARDVDGEVRADQRRRTDRTTGRRTGRRVLALVAAAATSVAGLVVIAQPAAAAGVVSVGAGSYTTDQVGPLPSGCGSISTDPRQFLTENAPKGAIPTNDWWSSLAYKRLNCAYSENLHAHPLSFLPGANGLGISYSTTPTVTTPAKGLQEYHYAYAQDVTAGVAGLDAPMVKVDGWTDWTVTPAWTGGSRTMKATIGHGLPFVYVDGITAGAAGTLTTAAPPKVWRNSGSSIGFTVNGHDYVAFAPSGSGWQQSGNTFSSNLSGKKYYSLAVLPTTPVDSDAQRNTIASNYARYAYAKVTGSSLSYAYDEPSATMKSTYRIATTPWEGTQRSTVLALYPHQWKSLTGTTTSSRQYVSPRGPMKIAVGTQSFTTSMKFSGVLPEVPAVGDSTGADRATLDAYLAEVKADPMAMQRADTYWAGKGMGRAARIAEIADQIGDTGTRDTALAAIKATLNDWFTAAPGQTEQVFAYNANWGTLIGYPASYGSDQELNDHHFHYGYFIAAAATLARFDPQWASSAKYGGMVDLLIRDANNYDRGDTRFPYLRDFDIYAGHDWASGHGAFAAGNNQESSSEGMNFANALIQWGEVTGNRAVRDAGIYIYTTQAQAIQNYWFDVDNTTFPSAFDHSTVGMVWGDGGSYATWFSDQPEKIQGINMLPVTGGHLYLGYHPEYVKKNYAEVAQRAGGAPTVWQDIIWEFLATGDPDQALRLFRAGSNYSPEEGETRAHTFHWIRNLAALGTIDTTVTADHPLAVTFSKSGKKTYVASNVTSQAMTVKFSDGTSLSVPAGKTATRGAITWSGGNGQGGVPGGPGTTTGPSTPPSTTAPSTTPPSTTPPSTTAPSSTAPSTTAPGGTGSSVRYLGGNGALVTSADQGRAVTLNPADGATRDGTPYKPLTWTATGVSGTKQSAGTAFALAVDSGTAVGNAVQIRVSFDFTGNGSWDRVETYRYFATDPVPGAEQYTATGGPANATGDWADLKNGSVKVEVWSALSTTAPASVGAGSTVTLPFR
ncbi:hypothetical protein FDO65_05530 [Nakamurella flava]|uniref:glucan endo-1,3-beta-D-glucosidase n=2 Tax=Nakamurella flava TaxID=2576308 RepID=A0A4U6QNE9_9ACTN|nr:hypothetical protein FDO65_05530 [Nakamurella flava]